MVSTCVAYSACALETGTIITCRRGEEERRRGGEEERKMIVQRGILLYLPGWWQEDFLSEEGVVAKRAIVTCRGERKKGHLPA